jgi:large subunit ribosomal protein L25
VANISVPAGEKSAAAEEGAAAAEGEDKPAA